jgi:hypothetical protein
MASFMDEPLSRSFRHLLWPLLSEDSCWHFLVPMVEYARIQTMVAHDACVSSGPHNGCSTTSHELSLNLQNFPMNLKEYLNISLVTSSTWRRSLEHRRNCCPKNNFRGGIPRMDSYGVAHDLILEVHTVHWHNDTHPFCLVFLHVT